jgi:hypothetical protein
MTTKKTSRSGDDRAALKTSDNAHFTLSSARIKPLIVGAWRGLLPLKLACWLCRKLCRDEFFNRDASLEIDRLVLENERLRAGGTR